jgi:hypothetical protein
MDILLASLLPVAAVLVVGVVGSRWIMGTYIALFIIVFVLCSLVIFGLEYALITSIKGDMRRQLNSHLDFVAHQEKQKILSQAPADKSEQVLQQRLKQLAHEVAPVMDADLRRKAAIANGDLGVVIDACNYLIEGFAQQIKWTRQASEQVMKATREVVDSSIEFAQVTETQIQRLSRITETGEKLVAFIQRLSNILQLSVDLALEMQDHRQELGDTDKHPRYPVIVDSTPLTHNSSSSRAERFTVDIKQQIQLLEDALRAIQEHTVTAESMISDLYSFRQRMDHSSSAVLSTAERLGSLAALAERWRSSVATFYLPGDAHQSPFSANKSERETIKFSSPS